jgi:nicotinamidase-related amidase
MGNRIGFGERPAVMVIDMQHDFCDQDAPTTLWPQIEDTFEPIRRLCETARESAVPVFYTQGLVAPDGSSAGLWRFKQRAHAEMRVQVDGSRGAQIIPELAPQEGDRVIRKWRPSAFFRTDVEVFLGRLGIDTLLLTGTSLSGCVRATAVDAFMRDIRPIIVREGIADRSEAVLDANLFDLEQKYADVVSLTEALDYLAALPQHGRSFGFSAR